MTATVTVGHREPAATCDPCCVSGECDCRRARLDAAMTGFCECTSHTHGAVVRFANLSAAHCCGGSLRWAWWIRQQVIREWERRQGQVSLAAPA